MQIYLEGSPVMFNGDSSQVKIYGIVELLQWQQWLLGCHFFQHIVNSCPFPGLVLLLFFLLKAQVLQKRGRISVPVERELTGRRSSSSSLWMELGARGKGHTCGWGALSLELPAFYAFSRSFYFMANRLSWPGEKTDTWLQKWELGSFELGMK